jgi:hypothetical protein
MALSLPYATTGDGGNLWAPALSTDTKSSALAAAVRLELLRGMSDLLMRFMWLMIPVLVKVYTASVAVNIRTRAFTGMLKAANFLELDELWEVVEVCHSYLPAVAKFGGA